MRQLISSKFLLLVALAFLIAGCGGGGGGTAPTPGSEWGTMKWDEGKWG
jgi:hypothetical protein